MSLTHVDVNLNISFQVQTSYFINLCRLSSEALHIEGAYLFPYISICRRLTIILTARVRLVIRDFLARVYADVSKYVLQIC